MVLAIDPGNIQSAYVVIDEADGFRPIQFAKVDNHSFLLDLPNLASPVETVVIEKIASYGMPVGAEVFDTCVWSGRFHQRIKDFTGSDVFYLPRIDEKINLCGSSRAKDSNIRQALIDRFAKFDFKNGRGTKSNPDFFYGFAKDIWAAYAVGITWLDQNSFNGKVVYSGAECIDSD